MKRPESLAEFEAIVMADTAPAVVMIDRARIRELLTYLRQLEESNMPDKWELTQDDWRNLLNAIDSAHADIIAALDRINDRLDTIETTVENVEANMPVQEEDNG